ncbi:outer membrane protein [Azospirillum sp. ST 5-10]|uniref:outer membrane protein n=1 Tax=unclassified Azospirillum TaxID=2630922 RepID=UPI003F49C0DE
MTFARIAIAGAVSAAVVAAIASAQPALAADSGVYVRAQVGGAFPAGLDDGNWLDPADSRLGGDLDDGFLVGAGVGYAFANGLRADVTLDYRPGLDYEADAADAFGNSGTASADASVLTGLVNLYYEVPVAFAVRPYVGVGVGFARNRLDTVDYSLNGGALARESGETQTSFAWALMAGASFDLTTAVTLDVGYRYLDAGELESSGRFENGATAAALSSDLHLHEAMATLRYRF